MNTAHLDEADILELALGTADKNVTRTAATHLGSCTQCARAIDEAREAMAATVSSSASTVRGPSPALRERLMKSIASTNRFDGFAARVAHILDVTQERALELLAAIDLATSWEPGPFPGVSLFHLQAGPRYPNAMAGFVRMTPGLAFPHHKHLGVEHLLILQGGFKQSDGLLMARGSEESAKTGEEHSFDVLPGLDLIYLTVIESGGLQIGDVVIGPGDPRL